MKLKNVGEAVYPIVWEKTEIEGIPVIIAEPKQDGNCSTLFYYHGWSSSPINQLLRIEVFALHGMKVIAPCTIHHGWRGELDYEDPTVSANYFWKCIRANWEEFPILFDALDAIPKTDKADVFLYGNSMGYDGSQIYRKEKMFRLRFAGTLFEELAEYWEKEYFDNQSSMDTPKSLEKEQFINRPLFVLGGSVDLVVPQEIMRHSVEALSAAGNPALYLEYEELGHFVTANMLHEAINFYASFE